MNSNLHPHKQTLETVLNTGNNASAEGKQTEVFTTQKEKSLDENIKANENKSRRIQDLTQISRVGGYRGL